MSPLEVVLVIALLAIILREGFRSAKRRFWRRRSAEAEVVIPTISVVEVDPAFHVGPLGPDREQSEVSFLGGGGVLVHGSTTDFEAWILAVLAKSARRMFEFGTCTGRTTYLWARNSPPDAVVTTITLAPDQVEAYVGEHSDDEADREHALDESTFEEFLYTGTPEATKIEQLFGDSKTFDETPYHSSMDLIFIDGSHAYSYVMSDTQKALRMITPGGLILWHDYEGPAAGRGTDVALIEIAKELKLFRIEGTRTAGYRAPLSAPAD
jgi:hypothetical protein